LLELKDPSRSFTWTNNQEVPVIAVLDRVLASVEWESKFSLANLKLLPTYDPAYDEYKMEFIMELHNVMGRWVGPTIMGEGGFQPS
jgi:hypothetical protein